MIRASILVSGGGANLQAILDCYYFREIPNFEIAAVISSVPEAHALERARSAHVPAYVVDRSLFPNQASFCNALLNKLKDVDTDLVVTAGFGEKLNYPILHFYKNRVIAVQPALFPAFCGKDFQPLKALEDALRLGVRFAGATAYFMTEEDTGFGPIIEQQPVEVLPGDTVSTLQERIMRRGEWVVLPKALTLYCQDRLKVEGERVIIAQADLN
jgi:phosphoribosylglycinamide formyltransferase-1